MRVGIGVYALCEGGRSSKRERADVAELLKKRVESALRLEDKLSRAVAAPAGQLLGRPQPLVALLDRRGQNVVEV